MSGIDCGTRVKRSSVRAGAVVSDRRTRLSARSFALVVLAALAVAGCGSNSSSSSGSSTADSGSASTVSQSGLGRTSGNAIKIGVTAWDEGAGNQGGIGDAPGLKGGEYYVNKVLGGVKGKQIDPIVCNSDATTGLEVNCANKFVSDHVVAVFDDGDAGFGSEKSILLRAGIPIFGVQSIDPPDNDSRTAYFFAPPEESYAVGPLEVFKKLGYKTISLTIENIPAYVQYMNGEVLPAAKKLGLTVHVVYYDASSPNWPSVAASLLATHPQITGIDAGPEADCESVLTALRNTGYNGPVLMGSCSQYVATDPKGAVNTYSYSGDWLPQLAGAAPGNVKKQIAAYNSAMKATGSSNTANLGQCGVNSFAGLVDLQKVLSAAKPPYTPTSIKADLGAVKNFQAFMGTVDTCNFEQWPGTSSCNHALLMAKVGAGDRYSTVAPGGYIQVDPSDL